MIEAWAGLQRYPSAILPELRLRRRKERSLFKVGKIIPFRMLFVEFRQNKGPETHIVRPGQYFESNGSEPSENVGVSVLHCQGNRPPVIHPHLAVKSGDGNWPQPTGYVHPRTSLIPSLRVSEKRDYTGMVRVEHDRSWPIHVLPRAEESRLGDVFEMGQGGNLGGREVGWVEGLILFSRHGVGAARHNNRHQRKQEKHSYGREDEESCGSEETGLPLSRRGLHIVSPGS